MVENLKETYVFEDDNKDLRIASNNNDSEIAKENKYFGFISMVLLIVNFALGIIWYRSLMGKIMICVGICVSVFCKVFRSKFRLRTITFVNLGIIIFLTSTLLTGFADMYFNRLIFRSVDIGSKLVVGTKKEIYVGLYNRNTLPEKSEYNVKSSNEEVIKIINHEAHIIGEGDVTLTVFDKFRNTLSQEFTVEEVRAYDYLVENLKLSVGYEQPIWISMFPSNTTDDLPIIEVVEGYDDYLKIVDNVYIPLKPGLAKIRAKHALGDKEFEVKIHSDFESATIKVLDPFETVTSSDGSILHYIANAGDVIRLGIETFPEHTEPYSVEWVIAKKGYETQRIKDVNEIVLQFEDHMEIMLNVQNIDLNVEFIVPQTISFISKGTE